MTAPSTTDLVNAFCAQVEQHLDRGQLDGPVRMDNTHTVVIVPVKGREPIYTHVHGKLDAAEAENVVQQIGSVPSLKGLIRS